MYIHVFIIYLHVQYTIKQRRKQARHHHTPLELYDADTTAKVEELCVYILGFCVICAAAAATARSWTRKVEHAFVCMKQQTKPTC